MILMLPGLLVQLRNSVWLTGIEETGICNPKGLNMFCNTIVQNITQQIENTVYLIGSYCDRKLGRNLPLKVRRVLLTCVIGAREVYPSHSPKCPKTGTATFIVIPMQITSKQLLLDRKIIFFIDYVQRRNHAINLLLTY